ncbi:MAG: glutamate-5-semialdehyde dehydrogenase [Dehalogenimonas sp.]|uniref:Gamma-glutamyl phosphate reductase n=1 Tax=Candidatus Dehalogenimonas loeffleri TaxID=3127115 RepID=A0ABZ2J1N8_9CHLR|nr:glutamate-5-semialdehyde dehydrogenase [Dehalogenimonas sp.]
MTAEEKLRDQGCQAKAAGARLACMPTDIKNAALLAVADALEHNAGAIIEANAWDQAEAAAGGMNAAMLDRLILDEGRIKAIAADVRTVAALPDPVGEIFDMRTHANGLVIGKKRVPLGVIAAIYESRPNVTVDITALCLKAGNAVILRGGKETIHSNRVLVNIIHDALTRSGISPEAVQFIDDTDRALVPVLLHMSDLIDLVIPRGGAGLIKSVKETSTIPVVAGGIGVCHTYVDAAAKIKDAVAIAYNAKVQRPTVCNAMDTLIVHQAVAEEYLPLIAAEWAQAGVEMRCDERALAILSGRPNLKLAAAEPDDWSREYLALIAGVRVVDDLDGALRHISAYGSGHSEAIVTEDYSNAQRFLNEVDAAAVYVNASTRFTDGAQFGLGAEIGISTQKMHARGPLGLKEITSYKWLVYGSGTVRP